MAPPRGERVNASYPCELPSGRNHGKRTVMTGAERGQSEPEPDSMAPSDTHWLGPPVEVEAERPEAPPEPPPAPREPRRKLLSSLLGLALFRRIATRGLLLRPTQPQVH